MSDKELNNAIIPPKIEGEEEMNYLRQLSLDSRDFI